MNRPVAIQVAHEQVSLFGVDRSPTVGRDAARLVAISFFFLVHQGAFTVGTIIAHPYPVLFTGDLLQDRIPRAVRKPFPPKSLGPELPPIVDRVQPRLGFLE